MDAEKTDRRILRTLRNLDDALMSLLEEKPLSQIGVTELCERADINRNTFYSHYSNPDEILRRLEQQLLAQIGDSLAETSSSEQATEAVLKALYTHKRLAAALLSDNAASDVVYTIMESARSRTLSKANRHEHRVSTPYRILMSEFSLGGGAAVVKRWAADGMQQSPEDVAKLIRIMGNYGAEGLQQGNYPEFTEQADSRK